MPGKYEKVIELLPIVKELTSQGKPQPQIADELGLSDKKLSGTYCTANDKRKFKVSQDLEDENRQKHYKNISMKISG